jgi:hypothetical protein
MKRLFYAIALLAATGLPASGRVAVVFRFASPPLPVEAGQKFSLCAANVGTIKADLTLQFVNVRTGAVLATRDLVLPPVGSGGTMPDPCLVTTAEDVKGGGQFETALVVALMVVRHGIFSRASAATASVQVTAKGTPGEPHLIATIPLHLATLVNGRNTPIETIQ